METMVLLTLIAAILTLLATVAIFITSIGPYLREQKYQEWKSKTISKLLTSGTQYMKWHELTPIELEWILRGYGERLWDIGSRNTGEDTEIDLSIM